MKYVTIRIEQNLAIRLRRRAKTAKLAIPEYTSAMLRYALDHAAIDYVIHEKEPEDDDYE